MTIGAPMRAVTELIGSAPSKPGIRAMTLQIRASNAPTSVTAGIRIRWLEVAKMVRQRCGTARPMKTIGPQ